MSIKVLNITEEGRGGGPLNRIVQVAHELKSHDIETIVVFPLKNSKGFKEKLTKKEVNFKQIRLHRLTKDIKHLLKYILLFPFEIAAIKRIIKKEDIDIVHCNGAWQIKGIIASYFSNTKSLWHMNDSQSARLVQWLFKWMSPLSDGFIFASNRTFSYYKNLNKNIDKKTSILAQAPVNFEKFDIKTASVLQEYHGKKILSVGYINENKGFHKLIKAFHETQKHFTDETHLFIVGTVFPNQQTYQDKLTKMVEDLGLDNVHFLGYRSDIAELQNAVDLYVCCSDFEASPISVWEALACGNPVLATDVGDIGHLFKGKELIKVVDINDVTSLAKEMQALLEQKPTLENQKELRLSAKKHFALSKNVMAHVNIYEGLINAKHSK